MERLIDKLSAYGAFGSTCVDLRDRNDARILRYSDLVRNTETPLIDGIIEEQSQPLLYVVDNNKMTGSLHDVTHIRKLLAMRGEPAWLGVIQGGRIDIYSTDLRPDSKYKPCQCFANQNGAKSLLSRLALGEELAKPGSLSLRDELLRLMTDAGQELRGYGISTHETIALIGRTLFFRYLIGRKIITPKQLADISPSANSLQDCFGTVISLCETNRWLDSTFNGDLLALPSSDYASYFESLSEQTSQGFTRPLNAIMDLDTAIVPGASQRRLDWGDLNFDHLPVGLLSETYEELVFHFDSQARHSTSVYYTPFYLAEYMVNEVLHELPSGSASNVLDPACGAGVFLVASFRKLVETKFQEQGSWPTRSQIRRILEEQLVGFDINAHARTLAALALYLTALDLDPKPFPVEQLKFRKLEGRVLIDVSDPQSDRFEMRPMLGSLGEHVSREFFGRFDAVVGNPPWTSLKKAYDYIDAKNTQYCRDVAQERGLQEIADSYQNPDNVPDLPFMWGGMRWAKPSGRIALALAGRWLFKQSESGIEARNAIFSAVAITGIVNGASLRQTKVWSNVDQPFCLVFADNVVPQGHEQFVYLSPEFEPDLNRKGRMRIDASDALPVSLETVLSTPTALKTLYRGTELDLRIVERIRKAESISVGEYLKNDPNLFFGQGYQTTSYREDDTFLVGKLNIDASYAQHPFVVEPGSLQRYQKRPGLHRARDPNNYKAPILLIRKTSRADRNRGRALVSMKDVAYPEAYFGFSAAKHPDGEFLVNYLQLLVHSSLFEYYALMTGSQFGAEREVLQAIDIKRFPFIPPESLSSSQKQELINCSCKLKAQMLDWHELDEVVGRLYGLNTPSRQSISDVVNTRTPFSHAKKLGLSKVTSIVIEEFSTVLEKELSNIFSLGGYQVSVKKLEGKDRSTPWTFLSVSFGKSNLNSVELLNSWMKELDKLGTSRITMLDKESQSLTVGLLNRYRYWTKTQAKLLASDIVWNFGAALEGAA